MAARSTTRRQNSNRRVPKAPCIGCRCDGQLAASAICFCRDNASSDPAPDRPFIAPCKASALHSRQFLRASTLGMLRQLKKKPPKPGRRPGLALLCRWTARTIALLPFILLIPVASPASAAVPATQAALLRPVQRTTNCTAGGCHEAQTRFKVRHGPAAVGACDACHTYLDETKHTFKLKEEKQALCTFCHIGGGMDKGVGKVIHKPVAEGDCTGCHNPHGGTTRTLLRKDNMAELCASCHGDVTKKRKYAHGPVASGSCAACHAAHRAPFPKLLAAQGRDLCISCHDQMGNQLAHMKVLHKPVAEDCGKCHETHASDHKNQLKASPGELCFSCHDKVKQTVATATHKHTPAATGEGCTTCHTPHGGNLAKLMRDEPAKQCLTCHDKEIKVADGRQIVSMAAVNDPNQMKHGPIRDGDCSGCHTPHGGPNDHLLAKPYSEAFYQPFSLEKYALCFSCHDKQLVLLEKTTGLTKFRNGDRNLHFLHVNKSDKGRNCRACHNTHTSKLPMHLRETVQFGKWEMPVGFARTATGGSCRAGCHEQYAYDREKPVTNQREAAAK